jgi:hypothetical protein
MSNGSKKSFHIHNALVMMIVTVIGFNCGKMIEKNNLKSEHPSMRAASSNSIGIERINPVYKKIAIGTPSPI